MGYHFWALGFRKALRVDWKAGLDFEARGQSPGCNPEGPTYTTIMELGPQNQNRDGFLGA